jgi:hypothetical protein
MSDSEGAVRAAQQAMELLPPNDLAERGFAMIILVAGLQMAGNAKGARDAIYSALTEDAAHGQNGSTYMSRLLVALCFVHWMEADLKELKQAAINAEELSVREGLWEALSVALKFKATVHYHQNKMSELFL